jgi:amidase
MRRPGSLFRLGSVLAAAALVTIGVRVNAHRRPDSGRFELVEATIASIQEAIEDGVISPDDLVQLYLDRIAAYDRKQTATHLNSYIAVNRDAVRNAKKGGKGHRHGHRKGVLFGIPVILKDNIDTEDMPTTAGSLALAGSLPRSDAFVTRKLIDAGAIIIGKATMTEFANFLTNGMPAGYSSLGGYGYNPYDPRPDPRPDLDGLGRPLNDGRPVLTPGGSSSGPGIAVAANLAAIGVGTETSGSILSPGTANMLVGIKPTVGLISRDGIIPIVADQDTAGPLTRTVRDAAILLGAMAGFDPRDPATEACLIPGNCFSDYTRFLDPRALDGARIGVPSNFPVNRTAIINNAINVLRAQGATVDVIVPLATQLGGCPSRPPAANYPPMPGCSTVLNYGFKRDLNQYFEDHVRRSFPIQSLEDVVNFNAAHMPAATKYDQDLAVFSQMFDISAGSQDTLRYQSDRAEDIRRSRAAIAAALSGPDATPGTADDYDALLFSGNSGAGTPAKAGYPSIVVPGGFFDNNLVTPAFPPGFVAQPGPAGVTFSGPAFSEPRLIALAYAFEQATHYRVPPASAPPLAGDTVVRR